MFAWSLACFFGVIGTIAGNIIPMGTSKPNGPVWMLGFGVLFAILAGVIGGSMDIVSIIKDRTAKPVEKHI